MSGWRYSSWLQQDRLILVLALFVLVVGAGMLSLGRPGLQAIMLDDPGTPRSQPLGMGMVGLPHVPDPAQQLLPGGMTDAAWTEEQHIHHSRDVLAALNCAREQQGHVPRQAFDAELSKLALEILQQRGELEPAALGLTGSAVLILFFHEAPSSVHGSCVAGRFDFSQLQLPLKAQQFGFALGNPDGYGATPGVLVGR